MRLEKRAWPLQHERKPEAWAQRDRELELARETTLLEFRADELVVRKYGFTAYWVAPDGTLYSPAEGTRFKGEDRYTMIEGRDKSDAWCETDSGVRFLRLAQGAEPATVEELDAKIEARETRLREAREAAETARRARIAAQRLVPASLSALEDRPLPTILGAYRLLVENGCRVEASNGRLEVWWPEQVTPALRDAVRVLLAARELVVAVLESDSRKDVEQRLPDVQVGVDGVILR